ncbi:MAG TPA: proton-conducting transporter membrane subunit [Thermodesulfovibrionia bacterium]|nr:proton-conducting transporter membrane subunit [Thermodesulfovibrionia bacterium]
MDNILLALAIVALGGVAACVQFRSARLSGIISLFSIGLASFLVIHPLIQALFHGVIFVQTVDLGVPLGVVKFKLDGLSAFFVLIIFVMSLLICIYQQDAIFTCRCGRHFWGFHWLFFNVLAASMVGVVVVQHSLGFLIFWEIMSLASFFLVIGETETEESRQNVLYYLVTTHIGAAFLIAAFLFLFVHTGSLHFEDYYGFFGETDNPVFWVFLLFFIGFAFKAGFVPFHTGLPYAYRTAASGISALMAGVMKKMAIYGIIRMIGFLENPPASIGYMLIFISLATVVFGVLYALAQKDVKGMLAYSSLENAGIIGVGLGAGLLGITYNNPLMVMFGFGASLYHALNHSLFKGLLFLASGALYRIIPTGETDKMGGMLKKMPLTGWMFFVSSLAVAGLPPFNGFISEFLLYAALLMGINSSFGMVLITRVIVAAGLALAGGLSVMAYSRTFGVIFLGKPRSRIDQNIQKPSVFTTTPMIILAALCLAAGMWPEGVLKLISAPLSVLSYRIPLVTSIHMNMLEIAGQLTRSLAVFLFLVILILSVRYLMLRTRSVRRATTWGCGYGTHNEKMQYTASSFAWPILNLLLHVKETVKGPYGDFPKEPVSYFSHVKDFVETFAEYVLCRPLHWVLERFAWIQSGHKQHYILYILVMLILSIIGALLG